MQGLRALSIALLACAISGRVKAQTPGVATPPPPAPAGAEPTPPAVAAAPPVSDVPPAVAPPLASSPPSPVSSPPPALPGVALPADAPEPRAARSEDGASEDGASEDGGSEDGEAGGRSAFHVWGRVLAGFEYERESSQGAQTELVTREYGFLVKQARLGVNGELAERFRINVSLDISDALDPEGGTSFTSPQVIRTALLEYRPSRSLRLRVGRYKRPFSRLELTSAADLPVLDRGLYNDLAIDDNEWGDRAVGAMLSGRLKSPKLRWFVSFTNPGWSTATDVRGVDATGRVQISLGKPISVGLNAGYKYLNIGGRERQAGAFGGDVDLEWGGSHVLLEAGYAQLAFEDGTPGALGALVLFEQRIALTPDCALAPTLFAEVADANASVSQSESVRVAFGVNLLAYSVFRVMPQVAFVRALGEASSLNPWRDGETLSLILSLAP